MRNLKRSKKWSELVDRYAVNPHPRTNRSIFPTIREFVAFAAVIGVAMDRKGTLDSSCDELDSRNYTINDSFMDTIFMIALSEVGSPEVLLESREEEMIAIFESYCEGGFSVIKEWQRETPADPYGEDVLVNGLNSLGVLTAIPDTDQLMDTVRF